MAWDVRPASRPFATTMMAATLRLRNWSCAMLLLTASLTEGCVEIADRTIPGSIIHSEDTSVEDGPGQFSLLSHPDHRGWTVHAVHSTIQHRRVFREAETIRVRYTINPLAVPAGLFACPTSGWAWAFSLLTPMAPLNQRTALLGHTIDSCLMAVMIVRSKPVIHPDRVLLEERHEHHDQPMGYGRVLLAWHGIEPVVVAYPIERGKAVLRASHLVTALLHARIPHGDWHKGHVTVTVWHDGIVIREWPLKLTLSPALLEQSVLAPASRWPASPVFTVHADRPASTVLPADNLEDQVRQILLRHDLIAISSASTTSLLRQELVEALSGLVDDQTAPEVGHWLAPTVLVTISATNAGTSASVTVTISKIQNREVLGLIHVPAGPNDLQLAADVAMARFETALGETNLPRPQKPTH